MGGAAAPLGRLLLVAALLLAGGVGSARGLGHPGTEHVGADHRDRREHEDPQDGQVGDPDEEQGELRHRLHPGHRDRIVLVVLEDPHGHGGVADPDLAAVADAGLGHLVAVDEHAVGGAEVADLDLEVVLALLHVRAHVELDVPPAHAGVVDPDVGFGAAPDDQAGRLERVPGLVDLEDRAGPAYLGVGGVALHPRLRLAPDPEPARGQVVGLLELDADRAREDVALRVRVVLDLVGELVGEGAVVRREAVEVDLAQLDVEVVGHHPPLAAEDLGVVVALALERGRDLHRLHRAAERAREGAGDEVLQPLLEPLQPAHVASFRLCPDRCRDGMTTRRDGPVCSVGHRSAVAHDCIGVPVHPRGRRRTPFCSPVNCDGLPGYPGNPDDPGRCNTPDRQGSAQIPGERAGGRGTPPQPFWSPSHRWANLGPLHARVAEQADAHGSGPCVRKDVGVQLPPRAP